MPVTKKTDSYSGTCLQQTICTPPSALMEQYTSPQLVGAAQRAVEHSYQTTLLTQHRAATAQKQEGNILPYLSLMLLLSL